LVPTVGAASIGPAETNQLASALAAAVSGLAPEAAVPDPEGGDQ